MLVKSGILLSIFLILALYTSFLATSFFTTSLSILKSTGASTRASTFSDFLISNLSTSNFELAKSTFLENFDASKPVAYFKSAFVK